MSRRASAQQAVKRWRPILWARQSGRCFYCAAPLILPGRTGQKRNMATLDHLVPRSDPDFARRHSNATNLVLACYDCNTRRGNRPWQDWMDIVRAPPEKTTET